MKTNKEIIDSLVEYFLTQEPRIVCRALANMLIDNNRIYNYNELPKEEADSLKTRMKKNLEKLHYFIENGPNGNLTMGHLDVDERINS